MQGVGFGSNGQLTGWWQLKYFVFSPSLGEDKPVSIHIFQSGWFNHLTGFSVYGSGVSKIPSNPKK